MKIVLSCVFVAVVAIAGAIVFLVVPADHPPVGLTDKFEIRGNESAPLYRDVRTTNVTGHPDRIALWLPHSSGETLDATETTCCKYIRGAAHWVLRNEPYRIYQAPSRSFVAHIAEAGAQWTKRSGGHKILGAATESGKIFNDAELRLIDWEGTNFVARANLTYMGNGNVLAVTRLVMDRDMNHIYQWGIIVNSAFGGICDAVHNRNCSDQKTLIVHETGHVYGLDDTYNPQCSLTVMYGYLSPGETRGRQIDTTSEMCVANLYSNLPIDGEKDESEEDVALNREQGANTANEPRGVVLWWVALHLIVIVFL